MDAVGKFIDKKQKENWAHKVTLAMTYLQKEANLEEIVRLVGFDSLSEKEQLTLEVAKQIREDYLQQNAFDEVDTYSSFDKQEAMMNNILTFAKEGNRALELGAYFNEIMQGTTVIRDKIARSKFVSEENLKEIKALAPKIKTRIQEIIEKGGLS